MALADQFTGKNIVITGGADGISKTSAALMAERGAAAIVIGDLNEALASETAAQISADTGVRTFAFPLDVSKPDSIAAFVSAAASALDGRIDVLVNGAGVLRIATIAETTPEKWDFTVNINLRGTFLVTREVWPIMAAAGAGAIVNVASVAARIGGIASGVDYTASKGGVVSATKSLAKIGGPVGIRANAVAPGVIKTKMTAGTEYSTAGIPLGRLGEADDVAKSIAFLASDESAYITGITLDVNGGSYLG